MAHVVGLVVPDVTNSFLGRVLRGAQAAARHAGYAVVLLDTPDDEDRGWLAEGMEGLQAGAVDGWLLFGVAPPASAALGPVVLIETRSEDLPAVVLDIAGGTEAAMRHLLELGHTKIAHLAAAPATWTFTQRAEHWQASLERAGVRPDPALEASVPLPFALDAAQHAARTLLSRAPTAVFCDDDLLAAGVYLTAGELGVRIPDELSVIGFAGTQPGDLLRPRLTTVLAPAEQLGDVAMRVLLDLLEDAPADPLTVLPVELRRGESTAQPRGAR